MGLTENLVIVESPSKCKIIEGYLGDKYKVIATCGHFRALNDLSQIILDGQFEIKYSVTKPKILKMLKEEILMSKRIILATDNDREGESIAWHICDACKLPLTTPRIIFHEITRNALQQAILSPSIIDMNKVNSQKSRQILDLYIGFTISPILWKYIQHKLSAGRCQTPALKMLYEREEMIKNQSYETKYKVSGIFHDIEFKLVGNINKEDVVPFLEACENKFYIVEKKESSQVTYSPPSILITSTLQQRASNIGLSPKQTMMCAQTLYEHGLITYMRTDTAAYSTSFIDQINKQICLQYGKEYIGEPCSNVDTHEGIRVTDIKINTVDFDANINKLYNFIYKHTFQSCMSRAVYIQTPYEIQMPMNHIMRYVSSHAKFAGWKIIKTDESEIKLEKIKLENKLEFMKNVKYSSLIAKEQCDDLLLHYTESQLINRLEKENIGRPSTYTSILDSIEKYVTKGRIETKNLSLTHYIKETEIVVEHESKCIEEKNKLKITDLGEKVTLFCYKYFDSLFNYSYTKEMELFLDNVIDWKNVNEQIIKIKNYSLIKIDEVKPEYKSLHCGLYKKHPLIIKDGPHGYYLEYKKEKTSLNALESDDISEWIKDQEISEEKMKILIDYMNQKKINENQNKINDDISIRKSERGYYIFYKTSKMKKPKFYSFPNEYMDETNYIDKIKDYIEKKYKLI
uniref:DNA topoisomerase n=1 Tax=viral metagenome TaxID=1070528 RepID=A0A6C0D0F9_9ZZZZ